MLKVSRKASFQNIVRYIDKFKITFQTGLCNLYYYKFDINRRIVHKVQLLVSSKTLNWFFFHRKKEDVVVIYCICDNRYILQWSSG